jgi:hypothetical protein|tara:strand:- start:11392 stop:11838 length:447 start_codon:yes stop_codon:yes gene_type:complete
VCFAVETLHERIINPVQMTGMNRIAGAFTHFGLAFDHHGKLFAAAFGMHHALTLLKGGDQWNMLTFGNGKHFLLGEVAEVDAIAKRKHDLPPVMCPAFSAGLGRPEDYYNADHWLKEVIQNSLVVSGASRKAQKPARNTTAGDSIFSI